MKGRTFSREGVACCDQGQDCTAADVALGTAFCSLHTVSTTSVCVHEKTDPQLLRKSRKPNSFGPSGNSLEVELHCTNHHCHRHQLQNQKVFILSLDFTGSEEKCVREDGELESRGCQWICHGVTWRPADTGWTCAGSVRIFTSGLSGNCICNLWIWQI